MINHFCYRGAMRVDGKCAFKRERCPHPVQCSEVLPHGNRHHTLVQGCRPSLSRELACCEWSRPDRNPPHMPDSGVSSPPPQTLSYNHDIPEQTNKMFNCLQMIKQIDAFDILFHML